ncbi:hypothetical protein RHGRI_012166 [Rhododendron griersonianum]|uniref:PGG domain-containing protein n=1 Tax=Rhododendron griersonianum TaxID=479676 RepID=A0AAV6KR30_9ERIC|nr:hypothetical protein RHGRI_012166 [Rhododendron griersonianum]
MEGKLDVFKLNQYTDQFALQVTPNNNTVLHVVAEFGDSHCVADILNKCPSLLCHATTDGDTPLHIAAAGGHEGIVKSLIDFAKSQVDNQQNGIAAANNGGGGAVAAVVTEMLRARNRDGDTPLHLAARLEKPLVQVLDKLLEWREDLIEEQDAYGWTPLHLAARCENLKAVKKLLEKNKSVAYVATNNDKETALHIAAAVGDVRIMEELLSTCPDCWEMVNNKGQNILHIAADMERDEVAACILEKPWASRLINRKDNEGNTPLHVLASNGKTWDRHVLASKGKIWLSEYPGADELGSTDWPRRIWYNSRDTVRKDQECIIKWKMGRKERKERKENRKKERDEEMSKMANTHMIVATLISTISFAAGFTIPGGYDGNQGPNQGMAVLVREAAFKAFVITNTIAVICSTSSVFLYVSAAVFSSKYEGDKRTHRYTTAFWLIIIAMVAMILAFIAGTYTVLAHSSGLVIVTSVIACSSFIVYAFELTRLLDRHFPIYAFELGQWFRRVKNQFCH